MAYEQNDWDLKSVTNGMWVRRKDEEGGRGVGRKIPFLPSPPPFDFFQFKRRRPNARTTILNGTAGYLGSLSAIFVIFIHLFMRFSMCSHLFIYPFVFIRLLFCLIVYVYLFLVSIVCACFFLFTEFLVRMCLCAVGSTG